MTSTGRWKVAAAVACVAVLAFAACNRDIGSPSRGAGRASPLIEGSRVRGTLVETVSPLGATSFVPESTRREFSAVVEHGVARDGGSTVAVSHGFPRAISDVEFTDREGRRARLVARAAAPGQPVQSFQVYRDGQLLLDVAFSWQDQGGGAWVLRERRLTVYDHGRALLTHTRTLDDASLASAALRLPSIGNRGALAGFLLPQRLEAENCVSEATMTVVAAGVVGAATAQLLLTPNPIAFIALGAAIKFYHDTMDNYMACLERQLPREE